MEFNINIAAIRDINPHAAAYLHRIPLSLWITCYYTGSYFSHKTSNVVESLNNIFVAQREWPILDMLNFIWQCVMRKRFERRQLAVQLLQNQQNHTPYCYQIMLQNDRWAHFHTVRIASPNEGIITQTNRKTFIVTLAERICTCKNLQANGILCGHAVSFVRQLRWSGLVADIGNPRDYVPQVFTSQSYSDTYEGLFSPSDYSL